SNKLSTHGNVDTAISPLKQLEVHVHCDNFITPTSRFADILLPASTLWDHEAMKICFEISELDDAHIHLRPQLVTPRGGS
ncbi:hypothetical protein Q6296_28835, partial [Klebsiella variicola]|uniref:hypothetical protein n=1 Tax=Klebsiella variicola TaxID=244366 RepID=UPI002730333A